METTMTDTDKVIQVAASRIQGLTRQVNHWKGRTIELEAALGSEKAARISADATRHSALNTGAANVELQKERAEHQETCLMFNESQARLREQKAKILTINDVVDGIRVQLGLEEECDVNRALENFIGHCAANEKFFIRENQSRLARLEQALTERDEAHAAIWGLGCEMTNLRCDLATARDERLRAEIADLRSTFDVVHFALGIKSGDNIIEAIDKLKQERDCAKDEWDREEERCKGLASDIEVLRVELRESQKEAVTARQDAVTRAEADRVRITELSNDHQRLKAELAVIKDERNALRGTCHTLTKDRDGLMIQVQDMRERLSIETERKRNEPPTAAPTLRSHPVKVGEWVKRTSFEYSPNTKMGAVAKVVAFDDDGCYRVTINGAVVCWSPIFCTPCDPPETTQDTPEDKETAAGAVTPKPGDKVRLVRVPTEQDCEEYDYTDPEQRRLMERRLHTTGTVLAGKHECGCLQVQMAHSAFVKAWPQSCIEIVDGK